MMHDESRTWPRDLCLTCSKIASEMIQLFVVVHLLYCVWVPYPLNPSAKPQVVSSFNEPEISAPFTVIVAI
jgi:hypothetical protein